ncbi:MAG: bifunctional oligoribonuclease/PAP phosphatase NrnA [Fidelibacterota bacterium]
MKQQPDGLDGRWKSADDLIQRAQRILCSTHVNPDGDGLGSQLAIHSFLEDLGKECRILNPSPVPEEYRFLSRYTRFGTYDPSRDARWVRNADLAIIFDIGDYSRLENLGKDLKSFGVPLLSIDHHPHPVPDGFTHMVHDDSACATGYLVHEYIKYSNRRTGRDDGLRPEVATALYVAVMTDTGSFRFSNTSPEAHEMASELIRHGVEPSWVYEQVYESGPLEKIHLMAAALDTVQVDQEAGLAWFTVSLEMVDRAGARAGHAAGFTDTVRSIKGVEAAVMIREMSPDECKINFRSKGRIRIDALARRLGGGGHPYASGATIALPLEQAVEKVVALCREEMRSQRKPASSPEAGWNGGSR